MTPEHLENIVGTDAAFRVISRAHGKVMTVPKKVTAHMIEMFGCEKAAAALIAELAGSQIIIPAARRYRIKRLREKGLSVADIAVSMSMTRRGVQLALSLDKNAP